MRCHLPFWVRLRRAIGSILNGSVAYKKGILPQVRSNIAWSIKLWSRPIGGTWNMQFRDLFISKDGVTVDIRSTCRRFSVQPLEGAKRDPPAICRAQGNSKWWVVEDSDRKVDVLANSIPAQEMLVDRGSLKDIAVAVDFPSCSCDRYNTFCSYSWTLLHRMW